MISMKAGMSKPPIELQISLRSSTIGPIVRKISDSKMIPVTRTVLIK